MQQLHEKVEESTIEILIKQCMLSELGGKETVFIDSEKTIKNENTKKRNF